MMHYLITMIVVVFSCVNLVYAQVKSPDPAVAKKITDMNTDTVQQAAKEQPAACDKKEPALTTRAQAPFKTDAYGRKIPKFWYKNSVSGSIQNLGLQFQFRGFKRWWLFDSDSLLFKNAHLDIGLVDTLTPVVNMIGGFIEFEPIAVFRLRTSLEQVTFFHLPINASYGYYYYPLGTAESEMDIRFDKRGERDELPATWTTGMRFQTTTTLQAQVGPIAVLNSTEFNYFNMQTKEDEIFFFEPFADALHKVNGWNINNHLFALYQIINPKETGTNLMLGAGWRYMWVQGTTLDTSRHSGHRVGAAMLWTIAPKLSFMESPSVLVMALWYLDDAYLNGALPYAAVSYSFNMNIY